MLPVHFNSSRRPEPIDNRSPDEIVMEIEEAELDGESNDEDVLALKCIPLDALLVLLRFLIPNTPSKGGKRWRMAQLRLVTLSHAAGMQGVGDQSLTQLAKELGCTRSLLSLYSTRLADQLGLNQVRGGKCRSSRETYRQNAISCHTKAGHKIATKTKHARQFSLMDKGL